MTSTTDTDEHRVMTDGGTESVRVVFLTYEEDADLEYDDKGQISNHDEVVDNGQTYREIRWLDSETVEEFDMETVEPGDSLWCEEVAELERGDSLRVDELRGDSDE